MTRYTDQTLFAFLDKHQIKHETYEHEAVFTVDEGKDIKAKLKGGHTKNLFLKDKSGQYVLVCAIGTTPIQLNHLHKHIDTKRLSFGKPDALYASLGVKPGSVTLFSLINDKEKKVRLILDEALFDHERVWFHPLRNTASTAIYSADIKTFVKALGRHVTTVDFSKLN